LIGLAALILPVLQASAGAVPACGSPRDDTVLLRPADLLRNERDHGQLEVDGSPRVVATEFGLAVEFDGVDDRLVLATDPLRDADEFTIEMLFLPLDVYPRSAEPRVLHLEGPGDADRRVTMELRLNDRHQWYLDTFLKSELGQLALIEPSLVHPTGHWQHAALVYARPHMTTYVNGHRELEGTVDFQPIAPDARLSIGARLNRVHWFAGRIALVRVTRRSLAPAEFCGLDLVGSEPDHD